jgi:hypothetical protein
MQAFKRQVRDNSRSHVLSSRKVNLLPVEDDPRALQILGGAFLAAAPTHWSFGQLCSLASPGNSPASYFRETQMPAPMIADCLNYNLRFTRGVEDIGVLLTTNGTAVSTSSGPSTAPTTDASMTPTWWTLSSIVSAMAFPGPGACRASSANGWPSQSRTRPCLRAIATCSCFSPTKRTASSFPTAVQAGWGRSPGASSWGTAKSASRAYSPVSSSSTTSAATGSSGAALRQGTPATRPASGSPACGYGFRRRVHSAYDRQGMRGGHAGALAQQSLDLRIEARIALMASPAEIASIREQTIDGPGRPLRIRIYTPHGEGPFPLMVFFHGSGFWRQLPRHTPVRRHARPIRQDIAAPRLGGQLRHLWSCLLSGCRGDRFPAPQHLTALISPS